MRLSASSLLFTSWILRLFTTQLLLISLIFSSKSALPESKSIKFYLQIQIIEQLILLFASILANISSTTDGTSPSSLPNMVQVLPLPVLPYANTVPLYPWRKLFVTSLPTTEYTLFWNKQCVTCGVYAEKIQSNLYVVLSWKIVWLLYVSRKGALLLVGFIRR